MAVGADASVGIGNGFAIFFLGPDGLAEIFEVHLVANAGTGRHDTEILERGRTPAQELIPFLVALVFHFDVVLKAAWPGETVDHDRVVDHQVDRDLRIDRICRSAEVLRSVAHRSEVNDCGDAGEVLHQDAGRAVGDFVARGALVVEPGLERKNVALGDRLAIFEAQHVFEQHLERCRQARHIAKAVFRGCGE